MPKEPATKRAIAFFDGQNLFHAAKEAFGHPYPNYDPLKLTNAIYSNEGWSLSAVRFYTGIPDLSDIAFLNHSGAQSWLSWMYPRDNVGAGRK